MNLALIILAALLVGLRPGTPPDTWAALADGRLLCSGVSPWSAEVQSLDPLYDVAAYLLYSLHPAAFGLGHALLIAFSAWQVRRLTGSDVAAGLVTLAAGVWPFAGPALVTLALAAWLLGRLGELRVRPITRRDFWAVGLVTTLWTNCDEGFRLAPILVGLAALTTTREKKPFVRLALAALAATFVHPTPLRRHLGAPEWLSGGAGLFDGGFWAEVGLRHPGVWAAGLLLLGGLVLAARGGISQRFALASNLLGLGLAACSARLLPLAAVLAASAWAGQLSESRPSRPRLATAFCGLLAVLAYAGLTGAPPYGPPRLAPQADPSLVAIGEAVERLTPGGEVRLFAPSADAVSHLRWFAPSAKIAAPSDELRAALTEFDPKRIPNVEQTRELLGRLGVTHVVCWDRDPARAATAVTRCRRLGLGLAAVGPLAVFGFDAGGDLDYRRRLADASAPDGGPPAPRPRRWFDAWTRPPARKTAARDEALLLIALADAERLQREPGPFQWEALCLAQSLTLAGSGGPALGGLVGLTMPIHMAGPALLKPIGKGEDSGLQQLFGGAKAAFLSHRDALPRDALLLAVRAARRGIGESPDDARAWLALGEAYGRLARQTRERGWSRALPALAQLRRAQSLAGFRTAAKLDRDLEAARVGLMGAYSETNQMDRLLDELRAVEYLRRRQARTPEDLAAAKPLAGQVSTLAEAVRRQRELVEGVASGRTPERAKRLADAGLTLAASKLLADADPALLGDEGRRMRDELRLAAGDAWDVPANAEPWADARASAARGDYLDFDRLAEHLAALEVGRTGPGEAIDWVALMSASALVRAGPFRPEWPGEQEATAFARASILSQGVALVGRSIRAAAEWEALRCLLASEVGQPETARSALNRAEAWDRGWPSPLRSLLKGLAEASRPR